MKIRPDWSDSSDLFGHVNLNDKFIPGAIIDFVKQAELDSRNPYFLCLDEMNLARVEYYLSDILSIIEQCLGHMCYSLMQIRKNIEITNSSKVLRK